MNENGDAPEPELPHAGPGRSAAAGETPTAGGQIYPLAPDAAAPYWRESDGTRSSYGSLRSGLDRRLAAEVGEAHLAAIGEIAAAALAASERGDRRETARLAAAARLCGEIRGLWPPSAVQTRRA
jgi:hypothetical protein